MWALAACLDWDYVFAEGGKNQTEWQQCSFIPAWCHWFVEKTLNGMAVLWKSGADICIILALVLASV